MFLCRMQVLNLAALNIASLALSSLTPKDDINAIHKQIEEDKTLRLLYGAPAASCRHQSMLAFKFT